MSDAFWEILVFTVGVALLIGGLSYCGHDRQESYRECIQHHSPRDCVEFGR
jgi:hypothetical protein